MALFPLQHSMQSLGQFDLLDTELASITGGEVMMLTSVANANSSTEKGAADTLDGYLYDGSVTVQNRVVAKRATVTGDINTMLCLADDGLAGYGTSFGETIGSSVGMATTGTNLGPHSAAGSGKVTLWNLPGLYEVTVSSLASDFVSTLPGAGLVPGGTSLGFNATGKLSHTACSGAVANSGVAMFVEFAGSSSLVTTSAKLLGATTLATLYTRAVVAFHAGHGTRAL
jgi:hypothetical protein